MTLILNQVPACSICHNSLLKPSNYAVFTCKHLTCSTCLPPNHHFCAKQDNGKFAFFVEDDEELRVTMMKLRELLGKLVEEKNSQDGGNVNKLILALNELIDCKIRRGKAIGEIGELVPRVQKTFKDEATDANICVEDSTALPTEKPKKVWWRWMACCFSASPK